jgi:hypothetical protein
VPQREKPSPIHSGSEIESCSVNRENLSIPSLSRLPVLSFFNICFIMCDLQDLFVVVWRDFGSRLALYSSCTPRSGTPRHPPMYGLTLRFGSRHE